MTPIAAVATSLLTILPMLLFVLWAARKAKRESKNYENKVKSHPMYDELDFFEKHIS